MRKDHFADDFYVAFISTLPFDEKTKVLINKLPDEATKNYWSRFTRFKIENKDLLIEAVDNLLKYSNWNALSLIMHSQIEMFNTEEILIIISESTQKMIAEKATIGNNDCYFIKRLFSVVHQRIGDDFKSYPALFELEIRLYGIIGWENMKCCNYMFKRNANLFAEIISLIYKKDDGSYDESIDSEKKRVFSLWKEI